MRVLPSFLLGSVDVTILRPMMRWTATVAALLAIRAASALALSEVICAGDCDYDRRTEIDELVTGVTIALGQAPIDTCRGFDVSGDGTVEVNELVAGVGNALGECPTARIVRHPCEIALPEGQDPSGVDCGYAVVREDRARTDGRTVRIPFAVLRALERTGSAVNDEPFVYLNGGPGGPTLDSVHRAVPNAFAPFQAQRDLVFFDQRGTGRSLPSLDCPEWSDAFSTFIGVAQSIDDDAAALLGAMQACHQRLAQEGVNFAAYTSSASAHDLEELLLALGYSQWNLYGISYGTRLGQTALRDTPDHIRSIGLDSNVPVEENLGANFGADCQRSLDTLFAGCAADPACEAAFPNLEQTFFELVGRFNADPVTVHPTDGTTGQPFDVVVTGDRLLLGIQQALYDTSLIPIVPLLIASTAQGDYGLLTVGAALVAVPSPLAWGMYYSIECNEEASFVTPDVIAAANAGVREETKKVGLAYVTQLGLDICAFWGSPPAAAVENEPVVSDIPALVLAGEYDPITRPAYGELVASHLSHSSFFEFPGTGHGVLGAGCATDIVNQFLDNPLQPPDGSCIDSIPPPDFIVPQ